MLYLHACLFSWLLTSMPVVELKDALSVVRVLRGGWIRKWWEDRCGKCYVESRVRAREREGLSLVVSWIEQ